MSPDVRDRDKPVRPRSRTPDERDAEVKRRKETIKREVSTWISVDTREAFDTTGVVGMCRPILAEY